MRQLIRALPHESMVYFGDTARVPYGEKSRETILRYSIENTIFLMQHEIKMLVVACNTATAYALAKLRQIFNIPILGVVEPGAEQAVQTSKNQRIAVLGTKGTIRSGVYQEAILRLLPQAFVVPMACPLFVPLVEERFIDHPAARMIVKEYLGGLRREKVDTVLLGCTHYPLLSPLIQEELSEVTLVDSATTCAAHVAELLRRQRLTCDTTASPSYQFFVSDDASRFQSMGEWFLGMPLDHVQTASSSAL